MRPQDFNMPLEFRQTPRNNHLPCLQPRGQWSKTMSHPKSLTLTWHKGTERPPRNDRAYLLEAQQVDRLPVYTFATFVYETLDNKEKTCCDRWHTVDSEQIFVGGKFGSTAKVLAWAEIGIPK